MCDVPVPSYTCSDTEWLNVAELVAENGVVVGTVPAASRLMENAVLVVASGARSFTGICRLVSTAVLILPVASTP